MGLSIGAIAMLIFGSLVLFGTLTYLILIALGKIGGGGPGSSGRRRGKV